MVTQKVATTLIGAYKEGGPESEPNPDKFWETTFKRIYSRFCHLKDVEFLWLFAHKAIWTNAIKAKFYNIRVLSQSGIPLVPAQAPDAPALIETRLHAFYYCPPVKEA